MLTNLQFSCSFIKKIITVNDNKSIELCHSVTFLWTTGAPWQLIINRNEIRIWNQSLVTL